MFKKDMARSGMIQMYSFLPHYLTLGFCANTDEISELFFKLFLLLPIKLHARNTVCAYISTMEQRFSSESDDI